MGSAPSKNKKEPKKPPTPAVPIQKEVLNETESGIRQNLVKHHENVNNIWDIYQKGRVLGEGMTGCVIEVVKINTGQKYFVFLFNL